ncbi:aspartyl-phosphate phosphatase Spo0E family protein [Piscibacillus salipiscarius]|uniref:Aspartyl-phosphate phosphatase Spo0E family protein n=1 Tax=Piscibacillus salipiscarius TaxID=299480 RepID=A0ABW5QAR5_9BACI|nr:aspartyl-phosphate phosphatase Spo0E family protein [Piscibacillus salipiscarius]
MNIRQKEQLYQNIKQLRESMIDSGLTKGLHDPETVRLSQELDRLLNQYENTRCKKSY